MSNVLFVGGPWHCEWHDVRNGVQRFYIAELPGIDFSPHPPRDQDAKYSMRKRHTYELHSEGFYVYMGLQ